MVILGSAKIDGSVKRSVITILGNIDLGAFGAVKGDAIAIGGQVNQKDGSLVAGKKISLSLPLKNAEKVFLVALPVGTAIVAGIAAVTTLFSGLGFLALIILVLTLYQKQVLKAEKVLKDRPWKSFLIGILGFCGVVPVIVFLTITVIGIPLAFVGAAVAMAGLILGIVAVGDLIGVKITERINWNPKSIWTGLLGILVLFLVGLIPVLGSAIHLCAIFFGLGAVIQTRFKG